MSSTTVNFEIVPYELIDQLSKHPNADYYAKITSMCGCNRNSPPDWPKYIAECADMLDELDENDIEFFAEDLLMPDAFLEMGFRYLTACGVSTFSVEGALYMFDPLTDELRTDFDRYVGDTAPNDVRAKAHSGAALAYWIEFSGTDADFEDTYLVERDYFGRLVDDPEGFEGRLGSLILAVRHANASVVLGLASPVALVVGMSFKEAAAKAGVDVERARNYRPLWRAIEKMKQEMEAEQRKDEERVQAGSPYICSGPDCKIQGVHKSAMKACAGKCPLALKPRYCSKECQRKDWPQHKMLCKQGRTDETQLAEALTSFLQPVDDTADADDAHVEDDDEHEMWGDGKTQRTPGPARIIEVPDAQSGENLRIISTTMSPREMRKFRERIMKGEATAPSPF
ncbi:hypothetical protein K466DRAFT_666913 [Polyporus arcularius HHB13444]|uniref:MYND-type domain-containing protein n=1 Tax=Polyporus arcularius HHB13444 TaxID=1314778 RepID=A0A5C3NYA8_9APHY|nr:hypothetical protein K466DRAFT_666913 [Polyporus arcularius HHB13444]